MRVSDFYFDLPEDLIAQAPPATRGDSRMLRLDRTTGGIADDHFSHLPEVLRPGDLLILNDSRVLPARLFATRAGLRTERSSPDPTGRIEVLLTEDLSAQHEEGTVLAETVLAGTVSAETVWRALVRPARKIQVGERLLFHAPDAAGPVLEAEVVATGCFGERTLRFRTEPLRFLEQIERIGRMPLPPYIHRDRNAPDAPADRDRYQTVFAQAPMSSGSRSAAAPTAGLHFTPQILAQLKARGVAVESVTLHVGLGTFQPVRVDTLAEIRLHAELYTLSAGTAEALNRARAEGRRIIAVGTTTTRTLEHCAMVSEAEGRSELRPHSGSTGIFLSPGHRFRMIDGLLTNFHLPESTLLMLVSAFAGREAVLAAYAHAVSERYRFFSYGDCMLIL